MFVLFFLYTLPPPPLFIYLPIYLLHGILSMAFIRTRNGWYVHEASEWVPRAVSSVGLRALSHAKLRISVDLSHNFNPSSEIILSSHTLEEHIKCILCAVCLFCSCWSTTWESNFLFIFFQWPLKICGSQWWHNFSGFLVCFVFLILSRKLNSESHESIHTHLLLLTARKRNVRGLNTFLRIRPSSHNATRQWAGLS